MDFFLFFKAAGFLIDFLDTPAEEAFDRLTRLASRALDVPVALVALMYEEREFFKSQSGLPEPWASRRECPLSHSFSQHVVGSGEPLIVEDAREHPLVRDNPAIRELGVVAYAGFPLRIEGGQVVGAFCAIDHHARRWSEEDQMILSDLAATAAAEIEWRVALEGEMRFQSLAETASEAILTIDAESVILSANPAVERLFGYTSVELVGQPLSILIPERFREAHGAGVRRYLQTGKRNIPWKGVELPGLTRDGGEIPVEISFGEYIHDGRHIFTGFVRDIRERKRAEEALRQSAERFRSLTLATTEIVWVTDPKGMLLPDQTQWGAFTGQSVEEYRGWGWLEAIHPDDRGGAAETWSKAVESRTPYLVEHRLRRHDGEYRIFEVRGVPVLETDGSIREWVGAHTDVTDRRRAQKWLRESEARHRTLLQAIPDLIFRHTLAGECLDFRAPDGARDLPVPAEQVRGQNLRDLLPLDVVDRFLAHTDRALGSGDTRIFEYDIAMPTGRRSFEARMVPSGTDEVLTLVRDITEQKRSEEREKELRQEQVIRAQAEAASRAKSGFLSRMSHELRTPLNAILGFGQLLALDLKAAENRESVEHILKAGEHLLRLVNQVLDIARIEAGQMSLSLEPVAVRSVLQECLNMVRLTADRQGITLLAHEAPSMEHLIQADRQLLKQVFLNLLSNAIKYNRTDGTVALSCEEVSEGRLRIEVRDTGFGIPDEKLKRLFTPFDRLGADQTQIEGTGLGLALSKGLVEAMGGRLDVQSVENRGSRFWVELPLAHQPGIAASSPGDRELETSGEAADATLTILVVDDHLANVRLVERVFRRRPRVRLLTAMHGRRGLELARNHRPDLILLDLNLPDLSGDEILRQLRQDPDLREIPVLMISSDAVPSQIRRMLAMGAQGYLTKPFEIPELLRIVDETLQREAR